MHRNEKRAVAVVDGGSALCTGETVVDGDDSDGADSDDSDDGDDGDDGGEDDNDTTERVFSSIASGTG